VREKEKSGEFVQVWGGNGGVKVRIPKKMPAVRKESIRGKEGGGCL